jgi:hypothetical protein
MLSWRSFVLGYLQIGITDWRSSVLLMAQRTSELGRWTTSVLVTDASGNTLLLDRDALSLLSRKPTIQVGKN